MQWIKENLEEYKRAAQLKGITIDFNYIMELDEQRKKLLQQTEELRARRNEIAQLMRVEVSESLKSEGKVIKLKIAELEETLHIVQTEYDELLLRVPNIPAPDAPVGASDKDNVQIRTWGTPPQFDFEPKDHVELGTALDLLDFETGVKVSGARGYYLKNELVLMHMGLVWLGIRAMIKHGFSLHITPTLIRSFALYGTGYFPFGRDNVYQALEAGKTDAQGGGEQEPLYLAGTSEMSLLAMFQNKTFEEKDLPVKVSGISPCYRSEVGSYGKDTKGLYRVHEFFKVEQVMITRADHAESDPAFERMLGIAEELSQGLELPYRVVYACTADMGAGKYKMYDIETWMPSRKSYGETHSNSHLTDWQARRLNIKYKTADGAAHFVHTLNNTVIAMPRVLIALLENNQQADGSVLVPKLLQEFVGKERLEPRS